MAAMGRATSVAVGRDARGRGKEAGWTARRWAGTAWPAGPEAGRRPVKLEKSFFFSISNLNFANSHKFKFFELKMEFSRLDPKIEVVQNLILYNFALGHILNFQTDFEM
jgi:hypothetical protein